jgi:TetR/AcrR family transcriptional repressor of nem operon
MARPREFNEATVLEAAMRCFWAQGYELTSVGSVAICVLLTISAVACGLGAVPFQHGHTSRASASSVD